MLPINKINKIKNISTLGLKLKRHTYNINLDHYYTYPRVYVVYILFKPNPTQFRPITSLYRVFFACENIFTFNKLSKEKFYTTISPSFHFTIHEYTRGDSRQSRHFYYDFT